MLCASFTNGARRDRPAWADHASMAICAAVKDMNVMSRSTPYLLPGQEHPLVHPLESSDVALISMRERFLQLRSGIRR